jgi:hypothetical protein
VEPYDVEQLKMRINSVTSHFEVAAVTAVNAGANKVLIYKLKGTFKTLCLFEKNCY